MSVQTYLSRKDYDKWLKVCEAEGCTPYMLAKRTILDRIHDYSLKEKVSEQPGETGTEELPGAKAGEQAMDVATTVKKLMERKTA